MKAELTWAMLALWLPLSGCGQKGPLVLPDTQHPRKKIGLPTPPASPAPTPAAPAGPSPSTSP